ncbi:MAG: hypothetical protein ACW972_11310 [Promethearchaeota archaeon]
MISLNNKKNSLYVLFGAAVFLWVISASIFPLLHKWINLFAIFSVIYISTSLLIEKRHRLIIISLSTIFFLIFSFRIDEMLSNAFFIDFLISITTKFVLYLLNFGPIMLMTAILVSFWIFRSKTLLGLSNKNNSYFYFISLSLLIAIALFDLISNHKIFMIDPTTFEFSKVVYISRISIIETCSGIYGLIIFSASFLIFINITKLNYEINNALMLILLVLGLISIFFINIIRILILILLNLVVSVDFMQEVHLYLGGALIIGFISIYWSLIWLKLPVNKERS